MTEQIPDFMIPPHVKEAIADYKFFEGFKKAFGVDDKPPQDTLDPDSDDDVSLDQFMGAIAVPDAIDKESDPGETALHSFATGLHLARAKTALLGDDPEAAHKHLNRALKSFTPVHGAVFARAAQPEETPLHSRSEEED